MSVFLVFCYVIHHRNLKLGASKTFVGYEYKKATRLLESCFASMLCKWPVISFHMKEIWHWGERIELRIDLSFGLSYHACRHMILERSQFLTWKVKGSIRHAANTSYSSMVWGFLTLSWILESHALSSLLGGMHIYVILKTWLDKFIKSKSY